MKVGLVTTSFPREPGDSAGSFVGAHARWLSRAGHEVEVVAAGDARSPARESLGTDVVRLASKLFYRGGAPESLSAGGVGVALSAAGFSVRQLAAVRRRLSDWDAVCAHWLAPSGLAVCAALAASRRKLPFLAIAHSGDVHLLERMRFCSPAARLLNRSGARLAFSSGQLASRFLDRAGPHRDSLADRSIVSPMGVDVSEVRAQPRRDGPMRVLFLGRLVPIKGIDVLIEALARLNGVELIICGQGPLQPALEKLAADRGVADRVQFAGEVRGTARDHFLAGADVLVVPSRELVDGRTEGMPVVILEAIACGTPVIASASGGMLELPDSVPKVAPGDVTALSAALETVKEHGARLDLLKRQQPIATAQQWDRVGTLLWRHWTQPKDSSKWRSA